MRANVLMALLAGILLLPGQASAESGFSSTRVNLRAGPGIDYPVLATLPAWAQVEIMGCLSAYSWCDVSWGLYRGWISARYLQTQRQGRSVFLRHGPPVTSFNFGHYWDTYYRDRPFYQHRDRWHPDRRPSTFGGGSQTQVHPGRQSAIGGAGQTFGPGHPPCEPGTPGCPPRYR